MKFLFVLPHPLIPTDRGNKHHTLNLLQHIARHHECHVLGFHEPGEVNTSDWAALESALPGLKVLATFAQKSGAELRREQTRCLLAGLPLALARYRNELLRAKLVELHRQYDLVCFDMYTLVEYQAACADRPTVLIASDAYSLMLFRAMADVRGPSRWARTLTEAALQVRVERTFYPDFDVVTTVSAAAAQWLEKVSPRTRLESVEVPADESWLLPSAQARPGTGPLTVLCWEAVSNDGVARAVARFVKRSWPSVHRRFPEAELVIWGKSPHAVLERALEGAPRVRLVSFVEDWLALLRTASLFLFPHRCTAGLHLKLFSAMAVGLPVVTAPESCGWFPAASGKNVFICRTDAEFTDACVALLGSADLRASVGQTARDLIMAGFTSAILGEKMLRVFDRAIAAHRRPSRSNEGDPPSRVMPDGEHARAVGHE